MNIPHTDDERIQDTDALSLVSRRLRGADQSEHRSVPKKVRIGSREDRLRSLLISIDGVHS